MEKAKWKLGLEELEPENVTMLEVYHGLANDLILDHPEVSFPEACMLVRNTMNRSSVSQRIRKEMEYFMRTGAFRKEQ